ncbi:hypothetical protein IT575_07445 [bacterium]|nr:hypothetical protein [bacterium]
MRTKRKAGFSAICGLLLAALATALLAGCPAKKDGDAGAAGGGSGSGSSGAAGDGAAADAPGSAEPSAADYISGKAGTEIIVSPDGFAMPRGWPLPDVLPPAGSTALPGERTAEEWAGGAVQWMQPFSNESGWNAVVSEVEAGLARSGFKLVRGEKTPVEPKVDEKGQPSVGYTSGQRLYSGKDGKFIVYLNGELRMQPESPGLPTASYELQVVYMDVALPLPSSSSLEDL